MSAAPDGATVDGTLDTILLQDLVDDVLVDADRVLGRCWGTELSGRICTPDFWPGSNHLKNKFCDVCRAVGFAVPADRVRTVEQRELFGNTNGRSAWTNGWRLCNQTMKCVGPAVVIFEDSLAAEAAVACKPVPDHWLRQDASASWHVHFTIKLGTIVPAAAPAAVPTPAATPAKRAHEFADDDEAHNERRPFACPPPQDAALVVHRDALEHGRAALGHACASAEDVAALWAAVCQENFQCELRDRLELCAATIGPLSRASRAVMHRMFRHAMERELALIVGDACLARVLDAAEHGGELVPRPESGVHLRLVVVCILIVDVDVWAHVVEQLSARCEGAASGAVLDDRRTEHGHAEQHARFEPMEQLVRLTESLHLMPPTTAPSAGSARPEESWRPAVRRTAEALERMMRAMDVPWFDSGHAEKACRVRTHYAEGVIYVMTRIETPDDGVDDACPDQLAARASAVLDRALELMGMVREPPTADGGTTAREGILRVGGSGWSSSLPHDATSLAARVSAGIRGSLERLLNGSYILEVLREEHPDGVRCAFVDWDPARDEPSRMSAERPLVSLSIASMHLDARRKVWCTECMDGFVLPQVLGVLGDGPVCLGVAVIHSFVQLWTRQSLGPLERAIVESRRRSKGAVAALSQSRTESR